MKLKTLLTTMAVIAITLTSCGSNGSNDATSNGQMTSNEKVSSNEVVSSETSNKEMNSEVKSMTGEELEALENDNKEKDKVLVVDVRDENEYKQGHIKHAINVPLDKIKEDPEVLSDYKDFPVIVYCNTSKKSGEAADILSKNGYKDVTDAQGVKDYEYNNLVKYTNITAKEFLDMDKENATIADARPEEDYNNGHIENAVSVPFDKVDENIDKVPEGKPVFTYCFTGNKSSELAQALTDKGYEVYNVIEGTKEYDYELVK
ncbi:MAG: rhodanese-like domain-containing protein [Tissierellia bacterium]|nr:rhodanese-like domain-containing protein [Tissierellia bacterium]